MSKLQLTLFVEDFLLGISALVVLGFFTRVKTDAASLDFCPAESVLSVFLVTERAFS